MNLGFYFLRREYLFNDSLFVNEIGGAYYADSFATTCHLLAPAAELLQQRGLGVGNKREVQSLCVRKLFLQRLFVFAHADNLVTLSRQLFFVCL